MSKSPKVNIVIWRISLYIGMTKLHRECPPQAIFYGVLAIVSLSPLNYPPNYH